MKTLELRNASRSLADYAADLDSESLVITSNNKPVAFRKRDGHRVSGPQFESGFRKNHPTSPKPKRGNVSSPKQVKEELLESSASNSTKRRRSTKARHTPRTRKRP